MKKLLSIMLSIMIAVTMMPATSLTAFATEGQGKTDDSKGGILAGAMNVIDGVTDTIGNAVKDIGTVLTAPSDTDDVEELDEVESELEALGFDTSAVPDDYDPDSNDNPQGSESTILQEHGEILTYDHGATDSTYYYGDDNELNDEYDFLENPGHMKYSPIYPRWFGLGTDSLVTAPGDFKGIGRRSCLAYLDANRQADYDESYGDNYYHLYLRVYDPTAEGTTGDNNIADLSFNYNSESPENGFVESMIDIDTGDYDGDGIDEIAVTVPQAWNGTLRKAEAPKVYVYKLKSDKANILNESSWTVAWTYTIPPFEKSGDKVYGWNSYDIVSGDVTKDGIDDMIISWGQMDYGKLDSDPDTAVRESESVLVWGDKKGEMLDHSQKVDYNEEKLCRVSFAIGDLNSDGENDVVMGGQLISDVRDSSMRNKTRCLGYYEYDENAKKLKSVIVANMNVVDGDYDEDNKWVSNNGFDDKYYSQPEYKTNLAITEIYGKAENSCIYLDSVLYSYDNDFEIVDELDEAATTDREAGPLYTGNQYVEYTAISSYYAGPAAQGLIVERTTLNNSRNAATYYADLIHPNGKNIEKGEVLKRFNFKTIESLEQHTSGNKKNTGSYHIMMLDLDQDSAVMKYTGRSSFGYTSPKVLAVLASAPYFEDVAENAEDGGDIKAFSSTGYGTTSGSGTTHGRQHTIQLGVHEGISNPYFEQSFDIGGYFGEDFEEENTTEFSVTYSTSAGEDCVAFYSIPTAIYEYEVSYLGKDDDGNTVPKKETEYISIPYQPATQTITMETYNEIQKANPSLPVLEGKAIESKAGDPDSYPSSTRGMKNAKVFEGSWSSPSYSNGGTVTQEISNSNVTTQNHTYRGFYETFTKAGGAYGVVAGYSESYTHDFHDGTVEISGATATGTVYNMVPDAKGYGYYFAWKLVTHEYQTEDGNNIPVVTYLTTDVTKPPVLPTDFRQDHTNTTDSQVALQWTYKNKDANSFDIYRCQDSEDDSSYVKIGTVEASDYHYRTNKNGETIYDEDKMPIRQYSFIDENRAPDKEYIYRLQVNRSKVPPLSIPTKPLKCKTKSIYNAKVSLSEDELTMYYDSIKYVSASVEPSALFNIINNTYQWQKYNESSDTWVDIPGANAQKYKFSKCKLEDAGDYRCRINSEISVLGGSISLGITSYSETLTVKYAKRNVQFGEIECYETKETVRFTVPITNCGDGARTQPKGNIIFSLNDGQNIITKAVAIDETNHTATAEFTGIDNGAYELTTSYKGNSQIFMDAQNPKIFIYLKGVDQSEWLSIKNKYNYNENLMDTLELSKVSHNGSSSANKKVITDSITKIEIVDTTNNTVYATFDLTATEDRTARIPCRMGSFDRQNLYVKVYQGDKELAGSTPHKLRLNNGSCNLYFEDISCNSGADNTISISDNMKICGADGYEDGDLAIRTGADDEAFTKSDHFKIGIYTPAGALLKKAESVNTNTLSAGTYILKPIIESTNPTENTFFAITCEESTLKVQGNMYTVTADGETINGNKSGTVSLIAPEQIDKVKDKEFRGGTSLTFKALPAVGYALQYWKINDGQEKERIIEADSDTLTYSVKGLGNHIDVKAVFALIESRITTACLGGDSTCTAWCTSDDIGDNSIIPQGKNLTFKAKPGEMYDFVEWRINSAGAGTIIDRGKATEDGGYQVMYEMGKSSATVYAVFQKKRVEISLSDHINAYYLNTEEFDPYIAEGEEVKVGSDNKIPLGATVIIRPAKGYVRTGNWFVKYKKVSGEEAAVTDLKEADAGKSIMFNIPADAVSISVETESEKGIYNIVAGNNTEHSKIELYINDKLVTGKSCSAESGSTYKIVATPDRAYKVRNWIINGKTVETDSTTYTGIVDGQMEINAETEKFKIINVDIHGTSGGEIAYQPFSATRLYDTGYIDTSFYWNHITFYEGEGVIFTFTPDRNNMLSSLTVNGKKQECTGNTFTIPNIYEVETISIEFRSSVYHEIKIQNNTDYTIKTEEGREVTDLLSLALGESSKLLISGKNLDADHLNVSLDGQPVECTPEEGGGFSINVGPLDQDKTLTISDNRYFEVHNLNELITALNGASNSSGSMVRLMNDIEIANDEEYAKLFDDSAELAGTFDGNGHSIYYEGKKPINKSVNSIFYKIRNTACVKNLTLKGFIIADKIEQSENQEDASDNSISENDVAQSNDGGNFAVITRYNEGTIENCAICDYDCTLLTVMAGIYGTFTVYNSGTIRNCLLKNVDITFVSAFWDPSVFDLMKGGFASEVYSGGKIESCYVDGFIYNDEPVTDKIFVYKRANDDVLKNCWYKNGSESEADDTDLSGFNVFNRSASDIVDILNKSDRNGAWGTWNDDNAYPVPIESGLEKNNKPTQPVKVTFKSDDYTKSEYVFSDEIELPEKLDDTDVRAWLCGTECYSSSSIVPLKEKNVIFEAVDDPEAEYGCLIVPDKRQTELKYKQYFKNLNEAITEANAIVEKGIVVVYVTADKNISKSINIEKGVFLEIGCKDDDITMYNSHVTIDEGCAVENNGAISIYEKASLNNYGSFQNNSEGRLIVQNGGSFRNGGTYSNKGTVKPDDFIPTCITHSWGPVKITKEPTVTEEGEKTFTCEVCGLTEKKVIDRISEDVEIEPVNEEIVIDKGKTYNVTARVIPKHQDKCIGNITWTSEDENIATVQTAAEAGQYNENAVITGINDGDTTITATYSNQYGYTVSKSMQCIVTTVIPVTDITFSKDKYSIFAGAELKLEPVITPENSNEKLTWTSDNTDVVTIDKTGVITAKAGGTATVTVKTRAVEKSVTINVIDADTITADFEKLREELEERIEKNEKNITILERCIKILDKELKATKDRVKTLEGDLSDTNTALNKLTKRYEATVADYHKTKEKVAELEKEIARVEKEAETATENVRKELLGKLGRLNEELKDAEEEIKIIQSDIEEMQKQIEDVQKDFALQLAELKAELEKRIARNDKNIAKLDESIKTLDKDLKNTKDRVNTLESNLSDTNVALNILTKRYEATVADYHKTKEKVARLEKEITRVEKEAETATENVRNELLEELGKLNNELDDAEEEIVIIQSDIEEMQKQIEDVQKDFTLQLAELKAELEKRIAGLEKEIARVEKEAETATEDLRKELLEKLGKLNNELDDAEEEIKAIQDTMLVMQEEVSEFNVEMELNCDDVIVLNIGDSIAVTAKLTPEDCIGSVEWTSDDENVAVVDKAGEKGVKSVITGKDNGIAKITAKYSNKYGHSIAKTFTCKVGDVAPLETVLLSADKCTLLVGGSTVLATRVIPATSRVKFTWTSSNNDVVTIDQNGQLTGVAEGEAIVTLKVDDGSNAITVTVDVTVIEEDPDPVDIEALRTQLSDTKTSVEGFRNSLTDIAEALAQLKETIDRTPGEPTDLTMQYVKIKDRYSAVDAIISELEEKLEAITESVDKEENLKQMQIELSNLNEAAIDTPSKIEAVNTDIFKLQKDVKERNRKNISVKLNKTNFTYTGKIITPKITVTDPAGNVLKNSKDYNANITYGKNVGKYTVKVTGKDNYKGTKTVTYRIDPKGTAIKTLKKAKRAFTLKWKKQSKTMSKSRITGYQIRYAVNSSFSGYKHKKIKDYSKTSVKINKLKKTKYYVQIRTYMKVKGKIYYSGWSKTKSVKIK